MQLNVQCLVLEGDGSFWSLKENIPGKGEEGLFCSLLTVRRHHGDLEFLVSRWMCGNHTVI